MVQEEVPGGIRGEGEKGDILKPMSDARYPPQPDVQVLRAIRPKRATASAKLLSACRTAIRRRSDRSAKLQEAVTNFSIPSGQENRGSGGWK